MLMTSIENFRVTTRKKTASLESIEVGESNPIPIFRVAVETCNKTVCAGLQLIEINYTVGVKITCAITTSLSRLLYKKCIIEVRSRVYFDSKSENPSRIGIKKNKSESDRNPSESKHHYRDYHVIEIGLNCGRCGYNWMPATAASTPRQPYRTIQGKFSFRVFPTIGATRCVML